MWIFTQHGLLSIVKQNPKMLAVRAREEKTLRAIFPEFENDIYFDAKGDYRYKLFIPRRFVGKKIRALVEGIDYDNFKESIGDRGYHNVLLLIWGAFKRYAEGYKKVKPKQGELWGQKDYWW